MRSTTASEPAPKTANKDCKVKVWSITDKQTTVVLGDASLSMTLVQQFEDNPTCEGLQISTRATTEAGTELISREVRSRFSRRCLSKTADGAQTDFRHDALGRVVEHVRYRLKPDGKRDDLSKAVTSTGYSFEHGGLVAQTTNPDGSEHRDELDGLQRVVRRAWRRSAQGAFVPLHCMFMRGAGDEAVTSPAWDYLPGGQAICEPLQEVELPGYQAWSRDLLDSAYTVEEGLGPHTLRYTGSDLQSRADGTLTCRETQRSAEGEELAGTFTTMDANGRVVAVEQTIDGILRRQCFTRDALGRVTRHERPDGSSVERRYHGLSEQVTELRVFEKGQAAASGRLVASQQVSDASSLSKRTVGNRQYRFEGDNVTLPDKTLLTLSKAHDAGEYTAGEALISGVTRTGNVTTLASDSGQADEGGQ
ncbi:YD repeat-containing protein, partial [Pseudomonas sp. URIL14HWK12:I9]